MQISLNFNVNDLNKCKVLPYFTLKFLTKLLPAEKWTITNIYPHYKQKLGGGDRLQLAAAALGTSLM